MHTPSHNPYLTQEDTGIDVSGQYRYLEDIDYYWKVIEGFFADKTWSDWQDINLDTYVYQDINPEISSALSNIFSHEGEIPSNLIEEVLDAKYGPQWVDISTDDYVTEQWYDIPQEHIDEGGFMKNPYYQDLNINLGDDYDQGLLPFVNVFDPQSIATGLTIQAGIDESAGEIPIKAAEVAALTPEMIEKTEGQYYAPYEDVQRETITDKLARNIGRVGTSGFAGSGARESGLSGAEKLYKSGYADVLANIEKFKGQATSDVLDTIYGWQELLNLG